MVHSARRLLALVGLAVTHGVLAAPADDIKALIEKGDARGAYAIGKQNPGEFGNPAFDFYFGVAAIDSGNAGEGVLALERYVTNFPDNLEARLELARGYFVIGEDTRAREEFDAVRKANPPPSVVANIDRYLDALRARESAFKTTTGAFLEFGVGYDSNINGGVSSAGVNLPVFGLVTVVPSGVKLGSSFMQLTGAANVAHPVAPGVSVFGSISGDLKKNERDGFDQGSYGVAGGLSYLQEKNLFRGTLSYGQLDVDNDRYRSVAGVTGEWLRQVDEFQGVSGLVQYAEFDYTGANSVRDSRLYGVGAGYRRGFVQIWSPQIALNVNYSKEENRRGRDDLGRDIWLARASVGATPAPKWAVSAGATYQYSDYSESDPLFLTTRRDTYYGVDATASYAFTRSFSMRGEVLVSKNHSNIELFEYRRNLFAVKARYDFK